MNILWVVITGLVVGVLAKLIMPGKDPGGVLLTMLLGIAGAVLANFIGRSLGWYTPDERAGIFASIIGAILLLAVYRMFARRGARPLA